MTRVSPTAFRTSFVCFLVIASPSWAAAQESAETIDAAEVPAAAAAPEENDPLAKLYHPDANGLSLAEVQRLALLHSPTIGKAKAESARTESQALWAISVFVPRIDVSGSYSRLSKIPAFSFLPGSPPFPPSPLNNWLFSASAQINVSDYFLKLPMYWTIPQRTHLAQVAQAQAQREQVSLQAAQSYFGLLLTRSAAEVTREGATALNAQVENLELLEAAGAVTRSDVMALRAQAAALDGQVIAAEGAARLAEIQLRQLIRFEGDSIPLSFPIMDPPQAPNSNVDAGVQLASSQRPEIAALKATISMRDAISLSHLAATFPRFFVRGQVDHASPNQRYFPATRETHTTWAVTAGLAWSPNDFIVSAQDWQDSKALAGTIAYDLKALEDGIELEVSSALNDWDVAKLSISTADIRLRAANQAFRDQLHLFEAGDVIAQDLLDREQAYRQAALARIQGAADLHIARLRYDRALGQLSEKTSSVPEKRP